MVLCSGSMAGFGGKHMERLYAVARPYMLKYKFTANKAGEISRTLVHHQLLDKAVG